MEPGKGYWVYRQPASGRAANIEIPVSGQAVRDGVQRLQAGWNLIGGIGYPPYRELPLPLLTEPAGALNSTVWGWEAGEYVALDAVPVGKGFWVFAHRVCTLRLAPNPEFVGPVMAYSPEVGKLQVHWPQALAPRSQNNDVVYRVYAAVDAARGPLVDEANLVGTLVDSFHLSVSELTPGASYRVTVVAEDADGYESFLNRKELLVRIMDTDNVLAATPRALDALGVTVGAVSGDGATVTVGDPADLEVGDYIVFDNPNGIGLRRIVSINTEPGRSGTDIVTEESDLADLIETGAIRSSAVISDLDSVPTAREGASRSVGAASYQDPDGFFVLGSDSLATSRPARAAFVDFGGKAGRTSYDVGIDLDYDVDFEPTFSTDAEFVGLSPQSIKFGTQGTLKVTSELTVDLGSGYSNSLKRNLWGRGHTFFYTVGGVPVVQEVFIVVYGELSIGTATTVKGVFRQEAEQEISIGVEWDPVNGYQLTSDDGFSAEVSVDLSRQVGVTAQLKLYPEIATRFYKAQKNSLFIEPSFTLDAAIEERDGMPVDEFERFDLDWQVDVYGELSMKMFGVGVGWQPPLRYQRDFWPVLSLPEIALVDPPTQVVVGQPATLALELTQGTNNVVPPQNLTWTVTPASAEGASGISVSSDGQSAEVIIATPGSYEVNAFAVGDSFLGEVGRRHVAAPLEVLGLTALAAIPSAVAIPPGVGQTFEFLAQLTDGGSQTLSDGVALSAEPGAPVTISGQTVFIDAGAPDGDITITGSYSGQTATATLSVGHAVTSPYLTIDVSAGPDAGTYPVIQRQDKPPGLLSKSAYKTTKIVLRGISHGTFTMGSPPEELGRSSNELQHEVTLTKDFHLGVFSLTVKQWEQVMGTRPSAFSDPFPVESVSYYDIRGGTKGAGWPHTTDVDSSSFVGKLRDRTGLKLDLPTEAQWEYACRAGTTTALNNGMNLTHIGSIDTAMPLVGWFQGNGFRWTGGVGQKAPNAWGLYDMHGGRWELCLDWNSAFTSDPVVDPVGSVRRSHCVRRGGSWIRWASACRSASRRTQAPDDRVGEAGFRLALPHR